MLETLSSSPTSICRWNGRRMRGKMDWITSSFPGRVSGSGNKIAALEIPMAIKYSCQCLALLPISMIYTSIVNVSYQFNNCRFLLARRHTTPSGLNSPSGRDRPSLKWLQLLSIKTGGQVKKRRLLVHVSSIVPRIESCSIFSLIPFSVISFLYYGIISISNATYNISQCLYTVYYPACVDS